MLFSAVMSPVWMMASMRLPMETARLRCSSWTGAGRFGLTELALPRVLEGRARVTPRSATAQTRRRGGPSAPPPYDDTARWLVAAVVTSVPSHVSYKRSQTRRFVRAVLTPERGATGDAPASPLLLRLPG